MDPKINTWASSSRSANISSDESSAALCPDSPVFESIIYSALQKSRKCLKVNELNSWKQTKGEKVSNRNEISQYLCEHFLDRTFCLWKELTKDRFYEINMREHLPNLHANCRQMAACPLSFTPSTSNTGSVPNGVSKKMGILF